MKNSSIECEIIEITALMKEPVPFKVCRTFMEVVPGNKLQWKKKPRGETKCQ